MPLEFIEGFKRISKIVSEKLKENQPEKIISSFGCMLDTYGSILCSEASKIGTKIIGQQHGGAYHELKTSYFYNTELSFFDQFCTWGVKSDKKHIPISVPILNKNYSFKENKSNTIIWVTTCDSVYNYVVINSIFGARHSKYFEHQKSIYSHLNEKVQEKIKIRLYPYDFGWNVRARWKTINKSVVFSDQSENFMSQVLGADFLIFDHIFGTTFLEAITHNIPSIVIANKNIQLVSEFAKNDYDKIRNAKIFFNDIEQAAEVINRNYSNITKWWNESERQSILKDFKSRYAYFNNQSFDNEWLEYLLD